MPILFIAVQCVQCSTMQVKQQKKSSNKWVCAVCNQRQSVLRIHARGHLARDIRTFVQEFNLSRMKGKSDGCDAFLPTSDGDRNDFREKHRTDWSEYLDPEEDDLDAEIEEDSNRAVVSSINVPTKLPSKESNHPSKRCRSVSEKISTSKKPSDSVKRSVWWSAYIEADRKESDEESSVGLQQHQ